MTPAELKALTEAATPGPWERVQVSNTPQWRENARLIALTPDLALLCAEWDEDFRTILDIVVGNTRPMDMYGQLAFIKKTAEAALAKLAELGART